MTVRSSRTGLTGVRGSMLRAVPAPHEALHLTIPRWERLRTRSSTHGVNNSRHPSGPARPLPGTKAIRRAHFRLGHRAPGRGGRQARTVSGCLNSAFLGLFSNSCGPNFSGHGYPTQCAANTCRPRSDRFWLLELRVSRTFLDNLRLICSVHGYPAQRAANTCRPPRTVSGCLNSAFLGLERNRSAVGKTKAPLVAGGPQQLTPPTPYSPLP